MKMVEKMANAIEAAMSFRSMFRDDREAAVAAAVSVLKAMREPPEAILHAGMNRDNTLLGWQAMIDAAIAEAETQP